jgi:hypothetical protein
MASFMASVAGVNISSAPSSVSILCRSIDIESGVTRIGR